jgi:hypothetical protein
VAAETNASGCRQGFPSYSPSLTIGRISEQSLPRVSYVLPQTLQYVRTIVAAIKFRRLGQWTVQNQRQPDHRLKIDRRPFGPQALEHLALPGGVGAVRAPRMA